jgi:hypothetical protein
MILEAFTVLSGNRVATVPDALVGATDCHPVPTWNESQEDFAYRANSDTTVRRMYPISL